MRLTNAQFRLLREESERTGKPIYDLIKEAQNASLDAQYVDSGDSKITTRHNRHEEDDLQCRCVSEFDRYFIQYHLLLNHCPSEGRRSERDGAKFKKMGLRAGYPDLVLHLPRHGYGCLGIELKTPLGKQRPSQIPMEKAWNENGNLYKIVRSVEQFIALVHWYIKGSGELIMPEVHPSLPIRPKAKSKRRKK